MCRKIASMNIRSVSDKSRDVDLMTVMSYSLDLVRCTFVTVWSTYFDQSNFFFLVEVVFQC